MLAALTAGGALGFLRHGFPPASSFMGDTGSNLLGYLLAVIAIQGSLKTNAVVALFFPLIVLAVPILDTGFVVAKRVKYRQPIYQADRWHFHHRMANIGFSQRRTLAYLYGWTAGHGRCWPWRCASCPTATTAATSTRSGRSVMLVCFVARPGGQLLPRGHARDPQAAALRGRVASLTPAVVDEGVKRELETGSFEVVEPRDGRVPGAGPRDRGVPRGRPGPG